MDDQGKRKLINNSIFFLVITVGFFIISLICITDCCLIKSNCNQNNTQDTTALYQKSVETDSSSKTIQFSSNNSNRTTTKTDTVITTQEKNTTSTSTNNPASLDSIVFNLTLAVNAINNVLSGGAIALGILTLFIGLVGLFGFNTLRDSIREYTEKHNKETQDSIDEIKTRINNAFNEFAINQNTKLDNFENTINNNINKVQSLESKIHQIDTVRVSLILQARYLDQTINCLFQATHTNIEQLEDQNLAGQLLEYIFHELQIAKLYRINLDNDGNPAHDIHKIATFEYLESEGIKTDIPHLEYIAKHDPNEENRIRAQKIIGRIEEREENKSKYSEETEEVVEKEEKPKELNKIKWQNGKMKKRKNRMIINRLFKLIKSKKSFTR